MNGINVTMIITVMITIDDSMILTSTRQNIASYRLSIALYNINSYFSLQEQILSSPLRSSSRKFVPISQLPGCMLLLLHHKIPICLKKKINFGLSSCVLGLSGFRSLQLPRRTSRTECTVISFYEVLRSLQDVERGV